MLQDHIHYYREWNLKFHFLEVTQQLAMGLEIARPIFLPLLDSYILRSPFGLIQYFRNHAAPKLQHSRKVMLAEEVKPTNLKLFVKDYSN